MKKGPLFLLGACLLGNGAFAAPVKPAKEESVKVQTSHLAAIALPAGSERFSGKSVPPELNAALAAMIEMAGPQAKQGDSEVLAWRGNGYTKARAPQLMKQVETALKQSGWTYEVGEGTGGVSVVSAVKALPTPRALVGMWISGDDGLILALTEMLKNTAISGEAAPVADTAPQTSVAAPATGGTILDVGAAVSTLNVMKNAMPKIPSFAPLERKAGFVRGWVKDANGKPLQNAKLGVRSTAVGGAYSGAQGTTDARGYYEIAVPFGAAHFYNAGYSVDYGEGRAAIGLHPADGELSSFASNVGAVENFVLLAYGIANRDDVQDNPRYVGNYYGGGLVLSWSVADERPIFASPSDLPANAVIELTLTPLGALLDGSAGRGFTIRKVIGTGFGQLYIVNIPVTIYRVSARLADGTTLKLKEVGPYSSRPFGFEPKEATGSATLQLRPSTAKADMATAARGGWDQVSLQLSR